MKNLKYLFLLILFLQSTAGFAQTKAETISWLTENISKNIKGATANHTDYKLESINECELIFTYKYKSVSYMATLPTTIKKMPDAGGFFLIGQNGRGFMYGKPSVHGKNLNSGKEYHSKYFGSVKIYLPYEERKLYLEIENALRHLATFCESKE